MQYRHLTPRLMERIAFHQRHAVCTVDGRHVDADLTCTRSNWTVDAPSRGRTFTDEAGHNHPTHVRRHVGNFAKQHPGARSSNGSHSAK